MRGHEPAPARDEGLLAAFLGVVHRSQERHFQPIDLVAEQRQHGEEERVRDQHGRQDAESAAHPELRDEVEADEGQAADRDGDRETGEEHGSPGGGAGLRRGVARRQPFVEELSEARHDEQRVVDSDPEADHRDQDRRDRVDCRHAREDEQEEERRHQRHDREHDRNQHRDERAEDDQEHDDRREQPESLGDSLLERRELGLAVVLDGDANRLDRLTHGVLHCHDLSPVLVLDRLVELRLGVGDATVVGERVLAEGVTDARQTLPCRRQA